MILRETVTVDTSGGAGVATGTGQTTNILNGRLLAIQVGYHGSAPAGTTDLTIASVTAPTETVLNLANQATDKWVYPRRQVEDTTGAGLTYDGTRAVCEAFVVYSQLEVTIAGCDALTGAVAVSFYWEE